MEAVKAFEVEMFLELERIKKPTAAVLAIARMSCLFFEAMREDDRRDLATMDQVESM